MYKILLAISLCLMVSNQKSWAQKMKDYKVASTENKAERTAILDALRVTMYKEFKQDFVFTVNTLNIIGNYAWLAVDVNRKDGKEIVFKADEVNFMDCCHTEALLVRKGSKWFIAEYAAFSTDVWYANPALFKKYKLSPKIVGADFEI